MEREQQNGRVSNHGGRPGGESEEVRLAFTPPARYRSLLVPLDGSSFGEHALPHALGLARRAGATVRLVQVHSPLESGFNPGRLSYDSGLDAWLRRRRQAYLDALTRRLAKVTPVRVAPLLAEGREIAASLCEVAGATTDLVVMATRARGPLGRLWHGGVADALLRRLTAPLLLVRGYDTPVDLTGDPAPRHVLIPLDGSEAAERILGPALGLGKLTGADHTLLRVLHQQRDSSLGYGRGGSHRTAGGRPQEEAWNYLRRLARRLGGKTAKVDARLLVADQATAASILWYAKTRNADLIALTTEWRGTLSQLFRGSVGDQVVRRATTPVLVVRTPG